MNNDKIIPELTDADLTRFWDKVDIRGKDDCWHWKAGKTDGYGQFWLTDKNHLAHRVALYVASGEQGIICRHRCDNPICCNPSHLNWGRVQDNVDDMVSRGRKFRHPGAINPNSKLNEDDVRQLRKDFLGGKTRKQIAEDLNVSRNLVEKIINRKLWSHID